MASDLPTAPDPIRSRFALALNRRGVLRGGAGLAGAALLAGVGGRDAHAQGLSGKIRVGYQGSNAGLSAVIEAAADAVRAANPDAEIELEPAPSGNFETQIFLQLNAGNAPDLFVITGLGIGELGAAGFLEPLDTYLATWDGWQHYPDVVRTSIAYNGNTYALPVLLDTHFLYYRKDLFEQAGLPRDWQPTTPDDILAAARQVKSALSEVMPYGLYAGANGGNGTAVRGFLPLVYAYGGSLIGESGRWIIDSPAIRSALAYYHTAYQVDETVPLQSMTAASPANMLRDSLVTGELAMLYDGSWVYGGWQGADPDIARDEIGYVLFPTADGRPPFAIGGLGASWYINAASQQKPLAWAVLAAANTAEALAALNAADPHVPPRTDAATSTAFTESPFLSAMVATIDHLVIAPPDPSYRGLIGVIQNATGLVATGDATPEEAVTRYAEEMTRILGEDRVETQS
ncbi:MAG: sugar ABC transporter substrate-binding protein [Thermomicrobiales bacterium]|nr:sugar ABC transporter substrate-binding protein [Thermomicrobiales bacterium]